MLTKKIIWRCTVETVQIRDLVLTVAPSESDVDLNGQTSHKLDPGRKVSRRRKVSQSKLILANAITYGYQNIRRIGNGGLIDRPIKTNGWLVMPPDYYKGIIPPEAWKVAEHLTRGIPVKGFLVAEDLRREQPPPVGTLRTSKISPDWRKIVTRVGWVAGSIAVAGAVISIFPVVLGIAAVGVALSYDPVLIAVTAEDEWICLYEWWD
jgi:hypothetical protein